MKAINTLTVTDNNTTAQITVANNIRIRIPDGVNAEWDISDTTAGITVSGTGAVSAAVSYEGNNKILVLDVTTNFSTSTSVEVSGLSYIGVTNTSGAAALEWSVDGGTNYGTGAPSTNVTIADGDQDTLTSITDTPANAAAEATGNHTIAFTVPTDGVIPASGKILIDFDDSFGDLSSVGFSSASEIDGS